MCRAAARRVKKAPSRLTESTRRQSSVVISMNEATPRRPGTPAFTKHESTRPSAPTVSANARSTAASSETSQRRASTRPPCLRSCSAAAVFLSSFVPQIHTAAPEAARPSAIPSPMPLFPPVIRATFPVRSNSFAVAMLGLSSTAIVGRCSAPRDAPSISPRCTATLLLGDSAGGASMKATDLLKKQHKEVKALFKKVENTENGRERRRLMDEIATALEGHTTIEEEIFYPAVRGLETQKAEEMVMEAFEEHHVVKLVLAELPQVDPEDERFEAKMTVLSE